MLSASQAAAWLLGAAALVGAAAGLISTARRLVAFLRRIGHLVDDLLGEPPRPGMEEGRPGLMARVSALEGQLDALQARMEEVRHEVTHNDGGSLKDAVRRIEHALKALTDRD